MVICSGGRLAFYGFAVNEVMPEGEDGCELSRCIEAVRI